MVVDGYWLVRPGSESEVEKARSTRRRMNVAAVAGGAVLAAAVLVLGYALVLPWVDSLGLQHVSPTVWILPICAGLAAGIALAWVVSRLAERRWERLKIDPRLTRNAYAYLDAYGGIPDGIPPQELWDALDVPGGPMRSALHARILAALPRAGRAAPK